MVFVTNKRCKVMENSQLLEENMRMMRPSTFPVSMRSHLTVLWRFLCVHASVYRENEKKREEKTDGGRERERERRRECQFERMQKSGMEETSKWGRGGKGEKECGAVTTSKWNEMVSRLAAAECACWMYGGCRERRTAYGPWLLPECTSTNERISPNVPEFVVMLTVSLPTPTFTLREVWLHRRSLISPICDLFFDHSAIIHAQTIACAMLIIVLLVLPRVLLDLRNVFP